MAFSILRTILIAFFVWGSFTALADEPQNSVAPTNTPATNAVAAAPSMDTDVLRSVLKLQELQEQLKAMESAVQQAREEADAAARRTEDTLTTRLNYIESRQLEAMQNTNRVMLIVVCVIAVIAILAVILTGWLQVRAATRINEVSRQLETIPLLAAALGYRQVGMSENNAVASAPTAAAQASSDRLLNHMDGLQKRVDELAQTAANGNAPQPRKEPVFTAAARAATVISKGQVLLNLDKPEDAIVCFEEAVAIDPRNVEAWIKKGTALEKLQRIDEAIAAYDKAIEADEGVATAYLFKAGVFNRQKRYSEALQCYEKALSLQKSRPGSAVATAVAS